VDGLCCHQHGPWAFEFPPADRYENAPAWQPIAHSVSCLRVKDSVCVYCGSAPAVQAEHVFPKSWYPATTPATCTRLTVPSCAACNKRFKTAEERFALAAMMTLDDRPDAAGVYERLSRSWKVDRAGSELDSEHRLRRFAGMLQRVVFKQPPGGQTDSVRAFLETPREKLLAAAPASPLQNTIVDLIGEKLGRGLYYAETGVVLERVTVSGKIVNQVFFASGGPSAPAFVAALRRLPANESLAPGLRYRFIANPQNGDVTWLFQLWGQIDIVAFFIRAEP